MATEMFQYLDPDGLDETVLNIGQIKTILEGQISDLGESIEEEMQDLPYARPDGLYPDMTVGAVIGADTTAQWTTRESTGSGAATVRSVQGASVVLNQLIKNGNFESAANWRTDGTLSVADGVCVVTGATSSYLTFKGLNQYSTTIAGHKYLFLLDAMSTTGKFTLIPTDATLNGTKDFTGITTMQRVGWIWAPSGGLTNSFTIRSAVTTYGTEEQVTFSIANYNCFDLTQMFGSGNEPQSVAEFEAMYPESYYPYSAPTLTPVRIAGIASTDANGDALDGVEWETQTLWGVGNTRDTLTSDAVLHLIRTLVLDGTEPDIRGYTYAGGNAKGYAIVDALAVDEIRPTFVSSVPFQMWGPDTWCWLGINSTSVYLLWPESSLPYATVDDFRAWLAGLNANGTPLTFAYITSQPTTTPISPALPMTYRVEQGGTESIIVPDGETSAAPVLTVAEPVNAGDEFARIWAAIESLGYTRNAAQLSRPVSLTDIGSIDETQKDTADVADIETTKEVQE